MSLTEFGPFAKVFPPGELAVPGHLELLSLELDGAQAVIDRNAVALREDDPRPWIETMLIDANWRPHLVACIAYFLDEHPRLDCRLLWSAMDAGSWVTPQLAVTACYADDDFVGRACDRVARRCPVRVPIGLTPVERHVATGPQGSAGRSAKMFVSLLTACEEIPALASWIAGVRADPEVLPLLDAEMSDGAAAIVARWRSSLRLRFGERGLELRPRAVRLER
jgi:hypothetical protein